MGKHKKHKSKHHHQHDGNGKKHYHFKAKKSEEYAIEEKITNSYASLSSLKVPKESYNRAVYIVALNDLANNIRVGLLEYDHASVNGISAALGEFCLSHRDLLKDPDDRHLIWVLRSRLDFLIGEHLNARVDKSADEALTRYLEERDMCVVYGPVRRCGQITLWAFLMLLSERFNYLRFHPCLPYFLDSLYTCWANLSMLVEENPRYLNHPVFAKASADQRTGRLFWGSTPEFWAATERLFNLFQSRIYFAQHFLTRRHVVEVPSLSRAGLSNFFEWMSKISSGTFRDIISKEFRKVVFENHVWGDEKERLAMEEFVSVDSVQASRAISHYRPEFIEKMTEFTHVNPIGPMIERAKQHLLSPQEVDPEERDFIGLVVREVDVDFDLLVLLCLKCYFLATFSVNVEDHFVWYRWETGEDSLPLYHETRYSKEDGAFRKEEISKDFPLLVQYFNEWGVLYQGTLYKTPDMPTCVATWAKLGCQTATGGFPSLKGDTKELFELFFPEENRKEKVLLYSVSGLREGGYFVDPFLQARLVCF